MKYTVFALAFAFTALVGCSNGENTQTAEATGSDEKHAEAKGIKFYKISFDEALAKAGSENKLLFVDVMTEWCAPCKLMDSDVFPRKDVGDFYNEHFVALKLDAEDPDMRGPELAEKYEVAGFPTFLYIEPNGTLKHSGAGGMDHKTFLGIGKTALGMDVFTRFREFEKQYNAGSREPEVMRGLIMEGYSAVPAVVKLPKAEQEAFFKPVTAATEEYLTTRKPSDMANAEDFKLISHQAIKFRPGFGRGHPILEYLVANYDQAAKSIPEQDLASFLVDMNYFGIQKSAAAGDKTAYQQYLADVTGALAPAYSLRGGGGGSVDASKVLGAMAEMEYAFSQQDYQAYLDFGWKFAEVAQGQLGASELLIFARQLERAEGGAEYLPQTLKFIQKAYDEHHNIYVPADYGRILAKLGEKDKAREYYAEVMTLADEMGGARGKEVRERFTKEMKELGL